MAFSGSFHGRTMGALSTTFKEKYRAPFTPLVPGVIFAPFDDLEAAAGVINDQTCAVIVEPVQGEGGVRPATAEFLQGLRALCDTHQALLIFDEVQCGLGRSGRLWAHEEAWGHPGHHDPGQAAGGRPAHRRDINDAGCGGSCRSRRSRQHFRRRTAGLPCRGRGL